ncbi:MAG: peroxiredoxin [Candidatus Rehaiarchaeum fermentans]|nr:peroxiredoxin [Candidatus Rehaiarchaeum fermentans]MCW1292966.1 peroxiredoxin [Candidatus Rehaiarchaeum fermentans]MCW1297547.1 peroxiredoxin [Candidatus Rehaiarchaeum fermentans]
MEIGHEAFNFKARAYFPDKDEIKEIKLSDYRGRWVLLAFYPGDFTFVCATDIEALMERYDEFQSNNVSVFVVSTDTVYSHKGWVKVSPRVSKSKIPMIEDHKKEIVTNYGFLNSETGMSRRGMVIIDPEGNLQYYSIFNDALGKDIDHIMYVIKGLITIYNSKESEGHICIIPARSRAQSEIKKMEIDVVKDIGKL